MILLATDSKSLISLRIFASTAYVNYFNRSDERGVPAGGAARPVMLDWSIDEENVAGVKYSRRKEVQTNFLVTSLK